MISVNHNLKGESEMKKAMFLLASLCFIMICAKNGQCGEFSSDPNILTPLTNTVWLFNFSNGSKRYKKIIGFLPEAIVSESTGSAFIGATDGDLRGLVMYGDKIGEDGQSYICLLQGDEGTYNIYEFNTLGSMAIGKFFYYDEVSLYNCWESLMIGEKVVDALLPIEEPIEIDQNQIISDIAIMQDDSNHPEGSDVVTGSNGGGGGGGCFITFSFQRLADFLRIQSRD